MSDPIVSLDKVEEWAGQPLDQSKEPVMLRLIDLATDFIENDLGIGIRQAVHTDIFDGDKAHGRSRDILYTKNYPVEVSSPAPVITENGLALTVTTGYNDGTFDVTLDPEKGKFWRRTSSVDLLSSMESYFRSWSAGIQNVSIVYTSGYTEATVPGDIQQAAIELSWLMYQQAGRVGTISSSGLNISETVISGLSDISRIALEKRRQWGRPRV